MSKTQKLKILFTEPTLKRLSAKWYIEYFEMSDKGRGKQHRPSFDLNRIKNIDEREAAAQRQLNRLRSEFGYTIQIIHNFPTTPVLEAINIALKVKFDSTEKIKTHQAYADSHRVFKNFLEKNKLEILPIKNFTKQMAVLFFDFVRAALTVHGTPYRAKTVNSHIGFIRGLFYELLRRDYISTNPFAAIKKIKENDPIRRCFEAHEKAVIFPEIQKDAMLLLAQTLLYRCAIRPVEITRLRPKYFDFTNGIIKIPGCDTKQNRHTRIINVASEILPYLRSQIEGIKREWFIFGEHMKPSGTKSCGRNTINLRHSTILKRLKKEGKLEDIEGLHFYSWKDSSAFDHIDAGLDIRSLQELMGHADINTTQKYFKRKGIINEKIQRIKLDLMPL